MVIVLQKIISTALFLVVVFILGIVYVLGFGQLEFVGLFLCMTLGFVSVSLIRNYLWRFFIKRRQIQSTKEIVVEFIVFFILLQMFLVLVVPLSSLIPNGILVHTNFVKFVDKDKCDLDSRLETVKPLWSGQVDFDKMRVVQGGLVHSLWFLEKNGIIGNGYSRLAMTFGSTIYVYDFVECPSVGLLSHEITHVWQMQKKRNHIFGFNKIYGWIWYQYKQIVDPDVLYDYGGEAGLSLAKQQNKVFLDFGIEQQAMIFEDFYLVQAGYEVSSDNEKFTPEYNSLLEYYVLSSK